MREILRTGEDAKPDSAVGQIVEFAQDKAFTWGTVAYDASTIGEREVKFAVISGTAYLYTRRDDTIYRVALSAV